MDWNAVSAGLVKAAKTTGLNALDYVPDALPNVPSFYVGEIDAELDITFRKAKAQGSTRRTGNDQATITCRILVAKSTDKYALRKLRDYMAGSGPESIIEAIAADETLNGSVDGSHVKRMRGNRLFLVGEKRYYGVEIDVFVIGAA
jgi:hypothetical protein